MYSIAPLAHKRSLELVLQAMVSVGGLVTFTLLMVNTSSVQLGVNPFSNVPFFLVIRYTVPLSATWNLDNVPFRALTLAQSALCTC